MANVNYNVVEFVQEQDIEGECQEKTKIFFLKTHKCASSSLQNIFLRFGEKRNLSFVLPMRGGNLGPVFSRQVLQGTPWEQAGMEYDIMALHTRYNGQEVTNLMGSHAKYVTMLRDPVDLFESAYEYYKMYRKYGMTLGNIFPSNIFTNDFTNEL